MNEFEIKRIWPEWGAVHIVRDGAFGKIYRIETTENGQVVRSFVRVVTMPPDKTMIEDAVSRGVNKFNLRRYFEKIRDDMEAEMRKCDSLTSPYLIKAEDIQFRDDPEGPGWTAYIRTPAYTPLFEYLQHNAMSRSQAISMAVEVCKGVAVLSNNGLVHGDINPGTVYVSEGKRFMVGDFGLRSSLEKAGSRLFKTAYGEFDSPEVVAVGQGQVTSDVYSVALVLAYAMNGGILPADRSLESVRDMTPELAGIIRKATSVNNNERYSSTMELLEELGKLDISQSKHGKSSQGGRGGFLNKLKSWIKPIEDEEIDEFESFETREREPEREAPAPAETVPAEKKEPEPAIQPEEKPEAVQEKKPEPEFVPDKSFAGFDVDSVMGSINAERAEGAAPEEAGGEPSASAEPVAEAAPLYADGPEPVIDVIPVEEFSGEKDAPEEVYVDPEKAAIEEETEEELERGSVTVEFVPVEPEPAKKAEAVPGEDIFDSVISAVVDTKKEAPPAEKQEEAKAPEKAEPKEEKSAEPEPPAQEEEFDFSPDPGAEKKVDPVAVQEADIQLSSFLSKILEETGLPGGNAPKGMPQDLDETKVWRQERKKKPKAEKSGSAAAPAEPEEATEAAPPEKAPAKLPEKPEDIKKEVSQMLKNILEETGIESPEEQKKKK